MLSKKQNCWSSVKKSKLAALDQNMEREKKTVATSSLVKFKLIRMERLLPALATFRLVYKTLCARQTENRRTQQQRNELKEVEEGMDKNIYK